MKTSVSILCLAALGLAAAGPAAAFEPKKPVEFIVTAGPGGGTDIFARTIQSIISKYDLMDAAVVVSNKGGAGGAEGFVYAASNKGDPYKLAFGTNNAYLLPIRAKVPYKGEDLTPVAALASDEFVLWVNGQSPVTSGTEFLARAKAQPGAIKVGGSQSKDVDQILTSMIAETAGASIGYIPFKSGAEAAVQLSGDHVGANVNNPSENLGQWQAGMVKPVCVFKSERLTNAAKVHDGKGWSDIPTCKESGIPIENYNMMRTVWRPAGTEPDVVAFYADVMEKVSKTPEWAKYLADSSQSANFKKGPELIAAVDKDRSAVSEVLKREGWLAN